MPYPVQTFNTISQWENFLNTNIILNGNEEITGTKGNTAYNGAVTFIKKSPLNWSKAAIYSGGGDIVLDDIFLGVAIFLTNTPDSLSFNENFYQEYVLINMTAFDIPLDTPSGYYNASGQVVQSIPANSAVNLFLAVNDIWVLGGGGTGGGGGSAQKEPKSYTVGETAGAPTAGTSTWTNAAFLNSWVILFIGNTLTPLSDQGNGLPYSSKPLASDTLTLNNATFQDQDGLSVIIITP